MAWRDASYGIAAAEAGMDVIMSPVTHTYFDYYPSDDPTEAYAIGGHLPLEQAYAFEPLAGLPAERAPQGPRHPVPGVAGVHARHPAGRLHAVPAGLRPRRGGLVGAGRPVATRSSSDRLPTHLERLAAIGVEFRPLEGPLPWQQGGTGALRRPAEHGGPEA